MTGDKGEDKGKDKGKGNGKDEKHEFLKGDCRFLKKQKQMVTATTAQREMSVFVRVRACVCVYVCMCVCMYVCMYVCVL